MKDLKITISGCAGSGKSTLAAVISKHLADWGYNVTVLPTDDKEPKKVGDYITDVAPNTNVLIEEFQTNRKLIREEYNED